MIAITALGRQKYPNLPDGQAFRKAFTDQYDWGTYIEHRGKPVTIEQLMWKWMRCELSHRAALPFDVQFFEVDEDPDDLRIQSGGPPEYCVRISDGWYWLLRRLIEGSL